jgi:deoxyribonuclease IV
MKKKKPLLLGAHMSIAGGLYKSIERGESIGCTCIQIFTKNNRQWFAIPLKEEEIAAFKKAVKNSTLIQQVVAHTSYLINIGSPNSVISKKSVESLSLELHRCEQLEIPYLVFHPGAHLKASIEDCLKLIAKNMNTVLEQNPGKTMLLIENTAGQGSNVGYTFEQLTTIYKNIRNKKRVGFCLDTCHVFTAGYDFRTKETYDELWKQFDQIIGLNKLKVMHINDSKKELGSQIDRHENIGKGAIGLEGFRLLFNDERFFDIPKILETPKDDNHLKEDKMNMETIYSLLSPATKKILTIY